VSEKRSIEASISAIKASLIAYIQASIEDIASSSAS
jgi:hypothetical protein